MIRTLFGTALVLAAVAFAFAAPAFAQVPAASPADTTYLPFGAVKQATIANLGSGPTVTVVAASGTAQTVSPGLYGGSAYDITLTGNCTFTVAAGSFTAGVRQEIHMLLRQDATGGRTITMPTGTKVNGGGTTPAFTATTAGTALDVTLYSTDGGTTLFVK